MSRRPGVGGPQWPDGDACAQDSSQWTQEVKQRPCGRTQQGPVLTPPSPALWPAGRLALPLSALASHLQDGVNPELASQAGLDKMRELMTIESAVNPHDLSWETEVRTVFLETTLGVRAGSAIHINKKCR